MTAEERLKAMYEEWGSKAPIRLRRVTLRPEDIDLIADLVIERMKNEYQKTMPPM